MNVGVCVCFAIHYIPNSPCLVSQVCLAAKFCSPNLSLHDSFGIGIVSYSIWGRWLMSVTAPTKMLTTVPYRRLQQSFGCYVVGMVIPLSVLLSIISRHWYLSLVKLFLWSASFIRVGLQWMQIPVIDLLQILWPQTCLQSNLGIGSQGKYLVNNLSSEKKYQCTIPLEFSRVTESGQFQSVLEFMVECPWIYGCFYLCWLICFVQLFWEIIQESILLSYMGKVIYRKNWMI